MKKIKIETSRLKDILGFSLLAGMTIHLYLNSNLIFEKIKNPTLLDTVNGFIVLISLSIIIFFIYSIFFWILTKDAHAVEKWALKNLTKVCYFILIMLGISYFQKYLSIDQFLTSVGATIVFWYGYRKYERDKEIEILKNYSEKYNEVTSHIIKKDEKVRGDYRALLSLWYEEYFLFSKGYISNELWNEWLYWICEDIHQFLIEGHRIYKSSIESDKIKGDEIEYLWAYCIDNSSFLDDFLMSYIYEGSSKDGVKLYKNEFSEFMKSNIRMVITKMEKNKELLKYDEHWLKGMKQFLEAK